MKVSKVGFHSRIFHHSYKIHEYVSSAHLKKVFLFLVVKSEPNSARASPTLGMMSSGPSSRSTSPQIRSASAIPTTPPPSQPAPVVTSQPEANENDRGDLIEFYNKVSQC